MPDVFLVLAHRPEEFRAFCAYSTEADDFDKLRELGFSDEDIWDIGVITAFFALSNRMAILTGMRPKDAFYAMGQAS